MIILGSQSSARKEILAESGYFFETMSADIDEKAIRDENPEVLPLKLARAKAEALKPQIEEDDILITSDQVVVYNSQIREKPENIEQAREFLKSYSGSEVSTYTAVVVYNKVTDQQLEKVDKATAYFKEIPDEVIGKILAEGEDVMRCSGAYNIEDPLLTPYIEKFDGDIKSMMGLPIRLLERLLKEAE